MELIGAGGTKGGVGRFFIGLVMMIGGGYLFLHSIKVTSNFRMGLRIFSLGPVHMTSGMTLIPLLFGIGFIFYNSKNFIGWLLTVGSFIMLLFGIISTVSFKLNFMTAYELITMLVLLIGGIGLFLSSLRNCK
ncbi:MAG: hypothetical protein ACMUIP_13325 [bacterium]